MTHSTKTHSNESIEDILKDLTGQIKESDQTAKLEEVGIVTKAGDGIAEIYGLKNIANGEMIEFESGVKAVAFNLETDSVGAIILGDYLKIREGETAKATKKILQVPVGEELIGRVVNGICEPVDGKGDIKAKTFYPVERIASGVITRESVKQPVHTGIKAIDAMIPIGRGQRELIIGDRQTGKTALALDTIINQRADTARKLPVCIYVAVGQKESKVAKIVETLKKFDSLKYSIVVSASASSPAALWYLAPFAGAAIGEYFRDKGDDALVIYDDLSKHAWAYRQISLLLRRPPGREAYPGDIFYLHSRLLERAAKLSKEKGGGSLTALPIVETQLGDVTAYIPTNIISITDGQIYLESDLFYQGIRPAVNVGLSVSRVGSAAQTKAMKKVAGKLRLSLAQFRELQAFVQFSSDVDEATKKRIHQGQTITEILKQEDQAPLAVEEQVVVFYAVLNDYFEKFPAADVKKVEVDFREYMNKFYAEDVLNPLKTKGELTPEIEEKLKTAIAKFLEA